MKQAIVPAINARKARTAKSVFLLGAIEPSPPICTPIEAKLEKPHNAYVAMTWERS